MATKSMLDDTLDSMMCVVYDQSDVRGTYYDDPGTPEGPNRVSSSTIFGGMSTLHHLGQLQGQGQG